MVQHYKEEGEVSILSMTESQNIFNKGKHSWATKGKLGSS